MSPELTIIITFVILLGLIAFRCPIFASLGIAGAVGILLSRGGYRAYPGAVINHVSA